MDDESTNATPVDPLEPAAEPPAVPAEPVLAGDEGIDAPAPADLEPPVMPEPEPMPEPPAPPPFEQSPPPPPPAAPAYQPPPPPAPAPGSTDKNKVVAGVLGILLGGLGIHKFYLGYTNEGIIMLAGNLLWIVGLGWIPNAIGLVEGIIYLTKSDAEFYQTYVVGRRPWF